MADRDIEGPLDQIEDQRRAIETMQGLRLIRGDRVLLTVSRSITREHAEWMKAELKDRFHDVEFTIVDGISGVAVQRDDTDKEISS